MLPMGVGHKGGNGLRFSCPRGTHDQIQILDAWRVGEYAPLAVIERGMGLWLVRYEGTIRLIHETAEQMRVVGPPVA